MPRLATGARERILEATVVLLREGGLSAAGLNEVVARAQAPKGSLYHYFPSGKVQIVGEALAVYAPCVASAIRAALHTRHPRSHRIRRLFADTAKRMQASGWLQSCAVGAVALDLGDGDDDRQLRSQCQAILRQWATLAAEGLPELPPPHAAAAGRYLITVLEGAQLQARLQRSAAPLREAAAAFDIYADSVARSIDGPIDGPIAS